MQFAKAHYFAVGTKRVLIFLLFITEDGATNVWMYAVIAAATVFVIFLAVACYTMR